MKVVCITNNHMVSDIFEPAPNREIRFMDCSSRDIFHAARDLIHLGWRLIGHPMYGNFRPSKQPFRTLALESGSDGSIIDMDSFSMIEAALEDTAPSMLASDLSDGTRHDFAIIDFELMKETLSRYFKGSTRLPK